MAQCKKLQQSNGCARTNRKCALLFKSVAAPQSSWELRMFPEAAFWAKKSQGLLFQPALWTCTHCKRQPLHGLSTDAAGLPEVSPVCLGTRTPRG